MAYIYRFVRSAKFVPGQTHVRGADESQWPLTSGEYDLKLMFDDGFTELAATKLKVIP